METVITNQNIEEILAQDKPLVIDFWAPWCGPCKMLGPTVEEIAAEYEGKAIVAKCDVDEADEVAMRFRVRNIPTLAFVKGGEVVDRTVGVVSKSEIESKLNALL